MKKLFLSLFCSLMIFSAFTEEANVYKKILQYRLEHSSAFQEVKNQALLAENFYKQSILSSYIAVELGTGNIALKIQDDGIDYSASPNVKLHLPYFSNTSLTFSLPFSSNKKADSISADLALSVDLYSKAIALQKLKQEEAKNSKTIASEKLADIEHIISAELLKDCNEIFSEYSSYLEKRIAKVRADLDFQKISLEAYPKDSVKYKVAELKALSAAKQATSTEKIFFLKLKKFFTTCGLELNSSPMQSVDAKNTINNSKTEDFYMFSEQFFTELSSSIPEEAIISTEGLKPENLKSYKEAEKKYARTLKQRKLENSSFVLSARLGFISTSLKQKQVFQKTSKSNALSAGLNFTFPGGNFYSGMSFDLKDAKHPSLDFSLAFNPLEIYYKKLSQKNMLIQNDLDRMSFEKEREKSRESVSDLISNVQALSIKLESAKYEYQIYKQNASDIFELYKNSYITKLDNEQAKLEAIQSLIRYAQTKAEILLFNIQTRQNFYFDDILERGAN